MCDPPSRPAARPQDAPPKSVDDFAGAPAPREAVRRARQVHHQHAELAGNSRGPPDNLDGVADLERVALDAGFGELTRPAPLDGPPLFHALRVRRLDVDERMGI